jgi:hypothetical protein
MAEPPPIPAWCARHNEDRHWTDPARGAFLVADGVGGQAAGERAAQEPSTIAHSTVLLPVVPARYIPARTGGERVDWMTASRYQ